MRFVKGKIVPAMMLALLLAGMLALAFNVQPVRAEGTIYIRGDGSIDPPTANITTIDKVTYIFTGNISDSVVIERDNIVVNGAGYTVQGTGALYSIGITLTGRSNVTVRNMTIENFEYGILLWTSSNNTLSGNRVTANNEAGIYLYSSSNNNILSGNNVTAIGGEGVRLYSSSNNTLSGNNVTNNWEGIFLFDSSNNNILSGNNVTANHFYGIVLGASSNNNVLSGNNVTNNWEGIVLTDSSNNIVSGNNVANNGYGIFLGYPNSNVGNNAFFHNNFINNTQHVYVRPPSFADSWDDGYPSGGNYWSDYTDRYPDAEELGNSGLWDTPYVIDVDNQDNYPFINPWTPPLHKFKIGDWVQTTANLNVREGPELDYTIIDTMPLGTIGQIVGGPIEADGFVWWNVSYNVGVRGWSAENWLELHVNGAPTCVVELQQDGVEISEVGVWEFFDIYVGDSAGDTGIKQVRFSSDNVQDGYPTGAWTDWFDWDISSEDWYAATKTKRWAFDTPGYKEVWAEVKDEIDQTAFGLATIFVPAPALPVLTSPLVITPVKDIYNVGDTLEAEFNITNIGDVPITLNVLTVGGRLNGFIPPEGAPDFTFQAVTLQPNEPYQYSGSLTLTQIGNYRFFVAYYIENPTFDEERLLDDNNWNTCVELEEGLIHTDRVKSLIVYKEDVVPDNVTQLRNLINRLKEVDTYTPPYLLDDKSFGGSAATLWIYWKSFFTDSWETYDMHYFAGLDYEILRVESLILAGHSLDRGDLEYARKLVQRSIEFGQLSQKSFDGAFQVYDRNLEQAEVIAQWVKDRCQAMVVAGVSVWNPTAGKVLDYALVVVDYFINKELVGEDEAKLLLVRDALVTAFYNEVPFCDGQTLSEYVRTNPAFKFTELQNYIMNSETLPDELYEAILEYTVEEAANLSVEISDMLRGGISYVIEKVFSPVEPRVFDSEGKVAGLVDGEVRHEISRSLYCNGTVTVFVTLDNYRYELAGTDEGTYGLEITHVEDGNTTCFTATGIPTSPNATHQYTVDWLALSVGEEGVTVLVDAEGDDVVDRIFSSDSVLASEEFIEKTSPTYLTHALTVITGEGGTTFPPLGTYACSANSTVQVAAFPNEGYVLDYWELDSINIGSNNPYTVLMQENHTLNAVFRLGIFDIAVTNVPPSKTVVGEGFTLNTNVTVANLGTFTETFNVILFANDTFIILQTVSLTNGTSTTITFTWNTTGFAYGNYTISAYIEPVSGETNTEDNTCTGGIVTVTIPGDVDGDLENGHYDVDLFDAVKLLACYGAKEGDSNFDPNCDIDNNGQVFLFDAVILLGRYGQKYP